MDATTRHGLPLLHVGQASKELSHNEALLMLDILSAAAVDGGPQDAPPGSPAIGQCFLVGGAPTGAWTGKADHLAAWTSGGWRFIAPIEGLSVLVRANGLTANYVGGAWEIGTVRAAAIEVGGDQVVGARDAPIADPAGGTQIDAEARTAIGAILAALRQHGLIAT